MKTLTKIFVLLTLFTLAFSWTAFFERLESLKQKKEEIKSRFDLNSLGLSYLTNISIKDLANFELPDIKSKLEKLKYIIPKDLDPAHHHGIDEFWTGAFDYFKLPKPTDLINCFGTVSGPIFFRKLRTINELLQHTKNNNNSKLHTDYGQFGVFVQVFESAHNCMAETEDFESLLCTLNICKKPEILKWGKYLYFQAKFASLADDSKSVMDVIDRKDFKEAGRRFGELLKKFVQGYMENGEDLLAYQAFGNGMAGTLGTPLPTDSLNCYDRTDAKATLDFFRGMAHAVAEGKWYKADESAINYWERDGKALLEKVSRKAWNCDMNSSDTKKLGERLNMKLKSQESRDKMLNYVKDHNILFYSYFRAIDAAFEKHDYLLAGSTYGLFLEDVARSS